MSIVRETYKKKWVWVLTGTLIGAGLSGGLSYRKHRAQITAFPITVAAASTPALTQSVWIPKINDRKPPEPAPAGMMWIPGGQFWMGAAEDHIADARPWHRVYVDGYWMDQTEVTNEQFARFVKATGYVTVAERKPRVEDYPRAVAENLVAGSVVFSPPDHPVELDNHYRWWSYVPGANWRHPEGRQSDKDRMKHPVVHIAYEDAVAWLEPLSFVAERYSRGMVLGERCALRGGWARCGEMRYSASPPARTGNLFRRVLPAISPPGQDCPYSSWLRTAWCQGQLR